MTNVLLGAETLLLVLLSLLVIGLLRSHAEILRRLEQRPDSEIPPLPALPPAPPDEPAAPVSPAAPPVAPAPPPVALGPPPYVPTVTSPDPLPLATLAPAALPGGNGAVSLFDCVPHATQAATATQSNFLMLRFSASAPPNQGSCRPRDVY